MDEFTMEWRGGAAAMPPATEIHDAPMPAPAPVAAPGAGGCVRAFVNDQLNSRLSVPMPGGSWKLRHSAELPLDFAPEAVLCAGERIAVQGGGVWSLHDVRCTPIARGSMDGSGITLDPISGHLLFTDYLGMLWAHRLSDGNSAFGMSLVHGADFSRALLIRRATRLLAFSIQRQVDMHADGAPEDSTLELWDLPEPLRLDDAGLLESARNIAALRRNSILMHVAATADSIVIADRDAVFVLDPDLQVRAWHKASFIPAALSLDEQSRIYLVTMQLNRSSLWLLTPVGERLFAVDLPDGITEVEAPPLVAHDHRVYLLGGSRLMSFSATGQALWECRPAGRIAGATITADDQLLLAAGDEVGAFNPAGEYRTLHRFSGDMLRTAPVITENGQILVASARNLYCLEPAKG